MLDCGGSIADAIEFDNWTDEQKRIARAGIEVERVWGTRISDARAEGYDAGLAAARAIDERDNAGAVRKVTDKYEDVLADVWSRLRMLLPQFSQGDARAETLREITAVVDKGITRARPDWPPRSV